MFFEVFKFYFAVLLLCHFLGDFYIQTKKMAKSKEDDYKKTFVHSILYTIPYIIAFPIGAVCFRNMVSLESLFLIIAAASIAHLVVDLIKCNRVRAYKNASKSPLSPEEIAKDGKRKTNLFIADQTCHILLLAFIALAVSNSKDYVAALSVLSSEQTQLLYLILLTVFLLVPASILFQTLFKKYQPSEISQKMNETDMENNSQKRIETNTETNSQKMNETDTENKTEENEEIKENIKGAGEIIGYMERLLMAIFFCLGQYTAVGFIIAAKSIARYDKISKKGAFAEYYLIGTLYSVLVTLLAFALLWYP